MENNGNEFYSPSNREERRNRKFKRKIAKAGDIIRTLPRNSRNGVRTPNGGQKNK